jgi:hypothetical protein
MEFESWLALEHANAANAETQVYCSSVDGCILEIEFDCWATLEQVNAANAKVEILTLGYL